jgi:altronate dehydratase
VTARALLLSPSDNVAVALSDLSSGTTVSVGEERLQTIEAIPQGHKIALSDLAEDAPVIKYGSEIGRATRPITRGSHVHVHNVESARLRGDR